MRVEVTKEEDEQIYLVKHDNVKSLMIADGAHLFLEFITGGTHVYAAGTWLEYTTEP